MKTDSEGAQRASALRAPTVDERGKRKWIYPLRRSGPHARQRKRLALLLITFYLVAPFIKVQGLPLIRLDVESNIFYFFGQNFRFTDGYFLVFIPIVLGMLLAWATSLWGRIWCGYACPQTVFVEWLIRPIEEWIEGPALRRKKNDAGPSSLEKIVRKTLKYLAFSIVILLISNAFLAYFVDPRTLSRWVTHSPFEHPKAFLFMAAIFSAIFFDLVWFREQFCAFLCPYGRFQSVLISKATPTVAYDKKRGEPRGSKGIKSDCIDCGLCVRVCPTGIDIRDGLQLECIQCLRCADACDSVMTGIKKPKGLIRTASQMEIEGSAESMRFRWRPWIYFALFLLSIAALIILVGSREDLKTTVLRQVGKPYVELDDGGIANYFTIRAINQSRGIRQFKLLAIPNAKVVCTLCDQSIAPNEEKTGSIIIIFEKDRIPKELELKVQGSTELFTLPFLHP